MAIGPVGRVSPAAILPTHVGIPQARGQCEEVL